MPQEINDINVGDYIEYILPEIKRFGIVQTVTPVDVQYKSEDGYLGVVNRIYVKIAEKPLKQGDFCWLNHYYGKGIVTAVGEGTISAVMHKFPSQVLTFRNRDFKQYNPKIHDKLL